ncbi:MAG: ParB/RepB/Spo0J family partition protein [Planctomycetota bacterium]
MTQKKLGRGLDSLIQDETLVPSEEVSLVNIDDIVPNSRQPRKDFNQEALAGLAQSINDNGLLQPIILRRSQKGYQVIAGERRWRAARLAGLDTIPAVIRDVTDEKVLELALIENIQREDLNAIERAQAYRSLIDEFQLTQEQAASRLGISRVNLANTLRLLDLPKDVQTLVSRGTITFGHARALLGLTPADEQTRLAERIVREDLSVRQVENLIARLRETHKTRGKAHPEKAKSAQIRSLEDRLRAALGTRVLIAEGPKKGHGRILVEFYSHDDFERIFSKMAGEPTDSL